MNISLHDQYKDYSTVDLLKITMRPESYEQAAIIEAPEILKNRIITQADIEKAEDGFKEDTPPTPKKGLLANIFKVSSFNYEKWLNVILAIAVFEYLHLLYTDTIVFGHLLNRQDYPYRMVNALSYIDLLYLPFVYYMFYKRMRWGWIAFFGVKLFTIEPSLLFYFNEYWPVEHGIGLLPYSLLTILLDIPILIFLWKQEISSIFRVNSRTKWLTVLSIVFMLTLLTCIGRYNHANYAELRANTENQTKTAREPSDTTIHPPKLLALIKARSGKPVDTTYMATGFYFLADEGKEVSMRKDKSEEIYPISRLPFASVENISNTKLETTHLKDVDYTSLCITFDSKGTKDLAEGTGNPLHSKIAVVVANRLLYVVENTTSIKTGVMCLELVGYSEKEIEEMRNSVNIKR
jgi:hypothetical protein